MFNNNCLVLFTEDALTSRLRKLPEKGMTAFCQLLSDSFLHWIMYWVIGEPPSRTDFCRVMWNAAGPGDTVNEVGTSGEAEGKEEGETEKLLMLWMRRKKCEISGGGGWNIHLSTMFREYKHTPFRKHCKQLESIAYS